MVWEEVIKKLAYSTWEAEHSPEGKHVDHYLRARRMLEQREAFQASINKRQNHTFYSNGTCR